MADSFADGEPEYLDDERWWQHVEEQDKEALGKPDDPGDAPEILDDFLKPGEDPDKKDPGESEPSTPPQPPPTRALHELTRKYVHPTFRVEFDVEAFSVEPNGPDLVPGAPWGSISTMSPPGLTGS